MLSEASDVEHKKVSAYENADVMLCLWQAQEGYEEPSVNSGD